MGPGPPFVGLFVLRSCDIKTAANASSLSQARYASTDSVLSNPKDTNLSIAAFSNFVFVTNFCKCFIHDIDCLAILLFVFSFCCCGLFGSSLDPFSESGRLNFECNKKAK